MKPSQLMYRCWKRIEFMLSLSVDDTSILTDESPPGDAGGFGVLFQYSDSDDWVHLALSAWESDCPSLKIVLTLPQDLRSRPLLANYELANILNRQGYGCATSYDSEAGTLQIRSNIVYAGYADEPGSDHNSNLEQNEATVNWMVQVLQLGREALLQFAATRIL